MRDSQIAAALANAAGDLAPGQVEDESPLTKNRGRLGSPGAPSFTTGSLTVTRNAKVTSAGETFQRMIVSKRGRHRVTRRNVTEGERVHVVGEPWQARDVGTTEFPAIDYAALALDAAAFAARLTD